MPTFTLRQINSITAKQKVFDLEVDGLRSIKSFKAGLDKRYETEVVTLYAYLELVANNHSLPKTKFRDITPDGEAIKEFEIKSKHLRVYGITTDDGKIIVYWGYKTDQDKDMVRFRSIKTQYLNSLKKDNP